MALASISVRGFRNLATQTIELAPGCNYVFGPNGAGKTSLLEAIHYLAIGRSFRRCSDQDLVGFGADLLVVTGRDDGGTSAEVRFDGHEKRLTLAGAVQARLSEYFGWMPVVVLLLEDIELVRGTPSARRGFIDMAIAKSDRGYIPVLAAYQRALAQRNRLLQRGAGDDLLAPWDAELVRTGVALCRYRAGVVPRLLTDAAEFCQRLSGGAVELRYLPSVAADADSFRQRLEATLARSRELGHTVVGPHRDDISISRCVRELRRFGSVGEQRLAGIALRLAEAELVAGAGRQPTFLLDEVASELDDDRSHLVLDLVGERGQIVYVAARRIERQDAGRDTKELRVEAGQVHEV